MIDLMNLNNLHILDTLAYGTFFCNANFRQGRKKQKNLLINEEVKIDKKSWKFFAIEILKKGRKLEKSIIKSGGGGKEVSEKRP